MLTLMMFYCVVVWLCDVLLTSHSQSCKAVFAADVVDYVGALL